MKAILALVMLALLALPAAAGECETTLQQVREIAVEKGLNTTEYTGEKGNKVKAAINEEFPGAPFDWADVHTVVAVPFPGNGTVNVGFFEENGCMITYLSNVPAMRWVMILNAAGVR